MTRFAFLAPAKRLQRGVILPVVMIFVLILLGLAGTVMRNILLEEKMSGNLRGQQLAFQAAEQALRLCETRVEIGDAATSGITILAKGPIKSGVNINKNYWEVKDEWDKAFVVKLPEDKDKKTVVPVAELPSCMVEQLDDILADTKEPGEPAANRPQFRVTARGVGSDPNTVVLLQSYLVL